MLINGYTEQEIEEALQQDEAPASWMTPEELASVDERITNMLDYFDTHSPGTFAQALAVYRIIGLAARKQFIQQYGYPPE